MMTKKPLTLMMVLASIGTPVWAADATETAPQPKPSDTVGTALPQVTPENKQPAAAAPSPGAPASVKGGSSLVPSEPAPGPLEGDRRNVRNWLLTAQKRGVGMGAYMPVWNDMENAVRAGAPEADIKTKLNVLFKAIGNQVRDSSQIQRWRPVKPKPNPDEDVEVIRVKWVGKEKGSDPLFRDKADKWYNNAVDMLPREQRSDPLIRRRLHDQRDQIYKEMHARWQAGEKTWGPKQYVNMNQDMGQMRGVQFRNKNQELRRREEDSDTFENNSQKNF